MGTLEAARLHWWAEDHLDKVLTTRERKVRTLEELEAAMKEPMTVAATRNVRIHESLEKEARWLWEGRLTKMIREHEYRSSDCTAIPYSRFLIVLGASADNG